MDDLAALPDSARLWLFALDGDPEALLADIRAFCASWASHGRSVRAAAGVLDGRVLAVAALIDAEADRQVGDANAGVSGCGIDALQHAVEAAAARSGLALTPALDVTFHDGAWRSATRPAFRRLVRDGGAGSETLVLDLAPATLGALRVAGGAVRPAGDSWHALTFGLHPSAAAH